MKPLVWFRYKDDVFLFWTHGQEKLDLFLEELIDIILILNLHMSRVKLVFHFLILKWVYLVGTFPLICTSNPQIDTSFYITHCLILIRLNAPLFTVRLWELVGYALTNLTFLKIVRVWNLGLSKGLPYQVNRARYGKGEIF